MQFDLHEVLRLSGSTVVRWPGRTDGLRVTSDRESVGPGDVFFPVRKWGPWPALFAELVRRRAEGVVLFAGQNADALQVDSRLGVLLAAEPPQSFFRLAAAARDQARSLVIGITGSSGKTATKDYLATLLADRYRVRATTETNNLVTDCAEHLLALEGQQDAAVVELGFGWMGDIERMAGMARPNVGVITKVTPAHLDGANNSWETVAKEKGRLGAHLPPDGLLVMHAEDPGCGLIPRSQFVARVMTFGTGNGADMRYDQVRCTERGTELVLRFFGQMLPVRLRAFGDFQAQNAAAAALVAHWLGVAPADIQRGLSQTPVVPQRFEIRRFNRGLTVIDDTFNATVDAMMQGLANAARLAGHRRRVAFLAGIAKLGEHATVYNRLVGQHAAQCGFATVLLYANQWAEGIREGLLLGGVPADQIHTVARYPEIPAALEALTEPDTLIYCKALYSAPAMLDYFPRVIGLGFEPVTDGVEIP